MPDQASPSKSSHPVRVLIVDDIPQVRRELRELLELTGAIQIAGEAANGREAIRLVEALRPDATVMDLEMPELDGLAAATEIKRREPAGHVLVLTIHDGADERQKAAAAGVDGFFVKGETIQNLIAAILAEGQTEKGDKS